jgi:hypothetical protein
MSCLDCGEHHEASPFPLTHSWLGEMRPVCAFVKRDEECWLLHFIEGGFHDVRNRYDYGVICGTIRVWRGILSCLAWTFFSE